MNWGDVIGWFGFACVLFCYFQVARQKWRVRSIPNQIGNTLGPAALGIDSFFYEAWVLVLLNAIWSGIALWTLLKLLRDNANLSCQD